MYMSVKLITLTSLLILSNCFFIKTLSKFILITEVLWICCYTGSILLTLYTDDSALLGLSLLVFVIAATEMVIFSLIFLVFKK